MTASSGPVPAACAVDYLAEDRADGFSSEVTVTNTGDTALDGWTLRWTFGGTEQVIRAWGATATQSGAEVAVTGTGRNRMIAPGASVRFGVVGSGPNVRPVGFRLDDEDCSST